MLRNSFVALILLSLSAPSRGAEIQVESWILASGVVGNGFESQIAFISEIQNPLDATRTATFGGAFSNSTFHADWDAAGFFNIAMFAQQEVAGCTNTIDSLSTSTIYLTPSVDSLLSYQSIYNYHQGSGDRDVTTLVAIRHSDAQFITGSSDTAPTILGDIDGQLSLAEENVFLDGNSTYLIQFFSRNRCWSAAPNSISHSDGTVEVHIQPVPEPATALLLFIGLLSALRRRRR